MNHKVHILDEMLKAAADATKPTAGQFVILRDGIEAALRLLTEELKKMKVENKLPWQAGYNTAIENILDILPMSKPDPLVMYIMRHFDDAIADEASLRNRASCAVADYKEHLKRNPAKDVPSGPVVEDFVQFEKKIAESREQDATAACPDLLLVDNSAAHKLHNECVVRAYNRGKFEGYAERSSETFGR